MELVKNENEKMQSDVKRSLVKRSVGQDLLDTIIEVNNRILHGMKHDKILDFIFDSLHNTIPFDRIGIALLENAGESVQLKMSWVKSMVDVTALNLSYSTSFISQSLKRIMYTNEPRIINDLMAYGTDHPESLQTQLALKDGIRSNLACPIRIDNKPMGIIFFSSCDPFVYDHSHIDSFMQIASEISLIVHHGILQRNFDQSALIARNVNMTLHDLKSPLSILQGFADLAVSRPWFQNLEPEARDVFKTFFRTTEYMAHLVSELSELSLLKTGAEVVEKRAVNVKEFLQEVVQNGKNASSFKNIKFNPQISDSIPEIVNLDRNKILRVLDNLFSNAIKYSKRGSHIDFIVDSTNNRLRFLVCDTGAGISENEFCKIFQEFGKTSTRPTEGESSSGQGLAIAKRIVDQHGGHITFKSQIAQGSTFSFWIPLNLPH